MEEQQRLNALTSISAHLDSQICVMLCVVQRDSGASTGKDRSRIPRVFWEAHRTHMTDRLDSQKYHLLLLDSHPGPAFSSRLGWMNLDSFQCVALKNVASPGTATHGRLIRLTRLLPKAVSAAWKGSPTSQMRNFSMTSHSCSRCESNSTQQQLMLILGGVFDSK